mgnify:CR=1 FL=1
MSDTQDYYEHIDDIELEVKEMVKDIGKFKKNLKKVVIMSNNDVDATSVSSGYNDEDELNDFEN